MANIRWSATAKESFEDALAYIARESPRNAMLVRDRVLNTLKHLESFSLGLSAPKGHFNKPPGPETMATGWKTLAQQLTGFAIESENP